MLDPELQACVREELLGCSPSLTSIPLPDGEVEEEVDIALDPEDLDYEGPGEPYITAHGRGLEASAGDTEGTQGGSAEEPVTVQVDPLPPPQPLPEEEGEHLIPLAVARHAP